MRKLTPQEIEVFLFLNWLRRDGSINMFGARPVVEEVFGLDKKESRRIVMLWMKNFNDDDDSYADLIIDESSPQKRENIIRGIASRTNNIAIGDIVSRRFYDEKGELIDYKDLGGEHNKRAYIKYPNGEKWWVDAESLFLVEKKNTFAEGGQVRKIKGGNFSEQIENGQKFKELIQKAFNAQTKEDAYPIEFIREIARTSLPIVKSKEDGKMYVKNYSYKGTLTHFSFLNDENFQKALTYVDRPKIRTEKFASGGEIDEWSVMYLPFDSDDYVVEKGFTSKEQAEKWAKSENLNELADEYEIIKVNYAKGGLVKKSDFTMLGTGLLIGGLVAFFMK
jgi:hypothetical protein